MRTWLVLALALGMTGAIMVVIACVRRVFPAQFAASYRMRKAMAPYVAALAIGGSTWGVTGSPWTSGRAAVIVLVVRWITGILVRNVPTGRSRSRAGGLRAHCEPDPLAKQHTRRSF